MIVFLAEVECWLVLRLHTGLVHHPGDQDQTWLITPPPSYRHVALPVLQGCSILIPFGCPGLLREKSACFNMDSVNRLWEIMGSPVPIIRTNDENDDRS